MAEIDTSKVAEITGFTVRWVQLHAGRGTIGYRECSRVIVRRAA